MRFLLLVSTLLLAALVSAQSSDDVDAAAQMIWDNDDEPWCSDVFLAPVTRTRTPTTTVAARTATRARSTRTIRVVRTAFTTTTVRSTATRTISTTTTTTLASLARRQASRPPGPPYLDQFSDAVVSEACLIFVDPRIVTVTARTAATRTLAARTTTVGTTTTTISTDTTVTSVIADVTSTTTTRTIVRTASPDLVPDPPEDGSGTGTTAGTTVTTGSQLCRDFTGSGPIAIGVRSHRFSRSLGQDSYIVDWNIDNPIDCCNRCASAAMGCSFWRYADSCLIVVNPRRVDTCPTQTAVITVTTSSNADRDSMAGPGPCEWEIRRVQG